jgi:aminoglycoside 3-N-acetyltransferase
MQVCVGTLPRTLLKKFPEAVRSAHISHSWAGFGAKAEYCVSAHGAFDPPAAANSPMGKAMELGGKVLFFGTGLAPTTFLHFVETAVNANFLQPAVCAYKKPDGSVDMAILQQHLPGHRNFYRFDAENCKFYQRAVAAGLHISETVFGMGKLHMIDLKELYAVAVKLCQEDPDVLLCDDPQCLFCSKFSHK